MCGKQLQKRSPSRPLRSIRAPPLPHQVILFWRTPPCRCRMGSRRDEWPPIVAGTPGAGLYGFGDDRDAVGATTAGAQSPTRLNETRTEPFRKGRAARAATRTAANAPRRVVAAASAG